MSVDSIFRPNLFAGKVAVVSGGGTGIGLAIAEELAQLGCKLVLASRKLERLVPAARGLSAEYGVETLAVPCNIRERARVDALMQQTLERFGRIDLLVNSGGGQFPAPAEAIREKGWDAVIDTNLNGTWHMCQAAAQHWMLAHGGSIVTVVADVERGFPGMAHTGAARAGVINFTKTLAVEWASRSVRINCVAPGIILSTGMHHYPKPFVEASVRRVPVQRLGTCAEVAAAVLFLLSPAAAYITGETLKVDGGSSLWGDTWTIAAPEQQQDLVIPRWPEERWPEHALAPGGEPTEGR